MPNLWESPNIHALPTPSEIKLAKEAIDILEVQLQNAVAALLSAQRAATTLQHQINKRKAWIAPIRRIPHDVISNIFLKLCQMDWSAPLVLGRVCHTWRESILANPSAWSYFQLQESQSTEFSWRYSRTPSQLASLAERITCLTMDISQVAALKGNRFPALERLVVVGGSGLAVPSDPETGWILNSDQFPRLKSIYAHVFLERITWRTFPRFVPLQAFSVTVGNSEVWIMIVENCREPLASLSISLRRQGVGISIPNRKVILLPRLEYLSIQNYSSRLPIPWAIETPALQAYFEASRQEGFVGPIHEDTKTVIYLRFTIDIDLSKFPQVRQLGFSADELDNVMGRLMEAPEICPNLEIMADDLLGGDSLIRAKELIAARNKQTGGNIQLRRGRRDGVFSYRGQIPSNCGYDMPCASRP